MKKIGVFLLLSYSLFTYAQTTQDQIHKFLDNWHHAAAVADEETFFGLMTKDARYIGTDASENWERDELKEWSKKFFERESAWDFKRIERHIYVYEDQKLAWFDETLDTWMGICRGSGVVILTEDGWKLKHYVISMTLPNEKTKEFLEIIK
jgi:hypothetical protein